MVNQVMTTMAAMVSPRVVPRETLLLFLAGVVVDIQQHLIGLRIEPACAKESVLLDIGNDLFSHA